MSNDGTWNVVTRQVSTEERHVLDDSAFEVEIHEIPYVYPRQWGWHVEPRVLTIYVDGDDPDEEPKRIVDPFFRIVGLSTSLELAKEHVLWARQSLLDLLRRMGHV
jgi:hypothetical protein